MKKLLIALSIILTSCATTSPRKTPYTDNRGDKDAAYAQSLMRNAVKFEERLRVKMIQPELPVLPVLPEDPDAPADPADPEDPDAPPADEAHKAKKLTELVRSADQEGDQELEEFTVSGSGVIVSNNKKNNTSVILTAWHVCDRFPVGFKVEGLFDTIEVVEEDQVVIASNMQDVKITKVLYKDKKTDTCVVEANHAFDHDADLADKMPPRGAMAQVVGAPLGEWGKFLVSMSDGRYLGSTTIQVLAGITDTIPTHMPDFAYYSFAGAPGYSGSGVYYDGKLVGLMTAGSDGYEHASYGPSVDALEWALQQAK